MAKTLAILPLLAAGGANTSRTACAEGSTAECTVDLGERIVGLFWRYGAYLDALGCLIR